MIKKLTVQQLAVELESLHRVKFYSSVLILMIKMSQSACEKLDCHSKKYLYNINKMLTTQVRKTNKNIDHLKDIVRLDV